MATSLIVTTNSVYEVSDQQDGTVQVWERGTADPDHRVDLGRFGMWKVELVGERVQFVQPCRDDDRHRVVTTSAVQMFLRQGDGATTWRGSSIRPMTRDEFAVYTKATQYLSRRIERYDERHLVHA